MLNVASVAGALFFGCLLFWGYLGALHASGDSIAVFRMPLAVLFALFVIWTPWRRRVRWPLAVLAMGVIWVTSWPEDHVVPARVQADLTIYQQNLRHSRIHNDDFLEQVRLVDPDVVTFQEVSPQNQHLRASLSDILPFQHYCDFSIVGGTAVLSRYPLVPGQLRCIEKEGVTMMQVVTEWGPVWIVSLHLRWPWPYGQDRHLELILPYLEELEGPILFAGDFNTVPWSHAITRLERATGTKRLGPRPVTFRLPKIRMPVTIDHVLADPMFEGSVVSVSGRGSDHWGLVAHLTVRGGE
ncbi:endonuclease/exonuclease/phosphatase family protein [Primorskyibacter sp. S187A]|uniref:endonuclease/exonuclease/phosphatase family protein n=1 Tax=Primorskyibacter sp. S187A TaxID=3415130 RepID=UPI003C7D4423